MIHRYESQYRESRTRHMAYARALSLSARRTLGYRHAISAMMRYVWWETYVRLHSSTREKKNPPERVDLFVDIFSVSYFQHEYSEDITIFSIDHSIVSYSESIGIFFVSLHFLDIESDFILCQSIHFLKYPLSHIMWYMLEIFHGSSLIYDSIHLLFHDFLYREILS